jgi:glutathione S-transferase
LLKLYGADWSPYFARVRIVMAAKGLAVEALPPPGGKASSPEFRRLSALGKMPVLQTGEGHCLSESTVIMDYLEDRYPTPSLSPDSALDRARMRFVGRYSDLYLSPNLLPFFRQLMAGSADGGDNAGRLVALQDSLADLDSYLDDGPYLIGSALSLADAALAPVAYYLAVVPPMYVEGDPLVRAPRLSRWWKFIQAEPVVQPVLAGIDTMFRARSAGKAKA